MTGTKVLRAQRRRDQVAALRESGLTIDQIAEKLGKGRTTVVNDLRALGLSQDVARRVRVDWDEDALQTLVSMYQRGARYAQIAAAIGCTEGAVTNRVVRLRDDGVLGARKRVAHNKGLSRPLPARHRQVFDEIKAIDGWEDMPRKVLAAHLDMPVNELIAIRSRLVKRGLIEPKSRGRRPAGKVCQVTSADTSTGETGKVTNLWALALGRA